MKSVIDKCSITFLSLVLIMFADAYAQSPPLPGSDSDDLVPGSDFADSGCLVSHQKEKDGYVVFDQTQVTNQKRLRDHLLSVISASMSVTKLIKARCSGPLGKVVPSFYLYNGANAVEGYANIESLVKQDKESEQILEAAIGEGSDIDYQITLFERAHDQQMEAYNTANRRANIFKYTNYMRRAAVLAAFGELATEQFTLAKFICFPDAATRARVKDSLRKQAQQPARAARDLAITEAKNDLNTAEITYKAQIEALNDQIRDEIGTRTPESHEYNRYNQRYLQLKSNLDAAQNTHNAIVGTTTFIGSAQANFLANTVEGANYLTDAANNPNPLPIPSARAVYSTPKTRITHFTSNPIGRNLNETFLNFAISKYLDKFVGEFDAKGRSILYGAHQLLAETLGEDMGKVADCMKQRANEFKKMADILKQRRPNDGPPDDPPDGGPPDDPPGGGPPGGGPPGGGGGGGPTGGFATGTSPGGEFGGVGRGDFAGCTARGSSGGPVDDPKCECIASNTCFEIPTAKSSPEFDAKQNAVGIPSGLAATTRDASGALNEAFAGDPTKANLAAGRDGQGAKLKRQIKALKKKINDDRRRKGRRPINFDRESRRLAKGLRGAVGGALRAKGITSLGQLKGGVPSPAKLEKRPFGGAFASSKRAGFQFPRGDDNGGGKKIAKKAEPNNRGNANDEIYVNENEGINGPNGNIFKIITLAYQRTGYPVLLNKVEDQNTLDIADKKKDSTTNK